MAVAGIVEAVVAAAAVVEAADVVVGAAEAVVGVAAVVVVAAAVVFERFQDQVELDASLCCLLWLARQNQRKR